MIKISIVTISFNQSKYLRQCIDSVLNQDYEYIEYIIVDPGSTDGSREIINSYGDKIIKIYENDQGPADGLNKGFNKATGDIYYFINSDDYLLPSVLSDVIDIFKKNQKIELLLAAGQRVDENGFYISSYYPTKSTSKLYVNGAVTFFQQGMFVKSQLFKKIGGFNMHNRSCWDGELFFNILQNKPNIKILMKKIASFRIYPDSITGSNRMKDNIIKEHIKMYNLIYGNGKNPNFIYSLFFRIYKLIINPKYCMAKIVEIIK